LCFSEVFTEKSAVKDRQTCCELQQLTRSSLSVEDFKFFERRNLQVQNKNKGKEKLPIDV
jgi:hypothetical protein